MPQPEIKLFGTFRSGSNLVRTLLHSNFDVKVHNNTHAYKHLAVPANYQNSVFQAFPFNVVGTVKDPFAFLCSVFRYCEKGNFRNVEGGRTFDEFIQQRFTIFDGGFKDFPRYRFANPVQYWNHINANLLSLPKDRCSIVRYESLLQDMQGEIQIIADNFGLKRTSKNFVEPKKITKNLGDQHFDNLEGYVTDEQFKRQDYYLNCEFMDEFTDAQKDFVFTELDVDVLKKLSYSHSSSITQSESVKFSFVENIQNLVELSQKQVVILEDRLEDDQSKNQRLVTLLGNETKELRDQVFSLQKSIRASSAEISKLELLNKDEAVQHKLNMGDAERKIETLNNETRNLKLANTQALKDLSTQHKLETQLLDKKSKDLIKKVENLKLANNQALKDLGAQHKLETQLLDKKNQSLNEKIENLKLANNQALKELGTQHKLEKQLLDEKSQRLNEKIEELKTSGKKALEEQQDRHKLASQVQAQKIENFQIEQNRLKGILDSLNAEASLNLDKIKHQKSQLEHLNGKYKQLNNTNSQLHSSQATQNKIIADLNKKLKAAESETQRLESAHKRASDNYYGLKNSFSFQFGNDFVMALAKPGKNTLLFPYRVVKNFFKIRKESKTSTPEIAIKVGSPTLKTPRPISGKITKPLVAKEIETAPVLTTVLKEQSKITIACIFDEFTTQSYQHECNLVPVPLHDWKAVLSSTRPDLLMVESAWKGSAGEWEFKVGKYANQDHSELKSLIKWCQNNDIPTVFWNKEDPIHFDKFIDAAKLFDVIFTTDANLIPKYKKEADHNKVYSLQFSAQPKLHNPIQKYKKEHSICFAGSYYANRHEDRRKDMDEMLDIAKDFGLVIYDRNYERNKAGETSFSFPERFKENVVGTLPYSEIDKAYKGYDFILNVNSVKESPTMFSRRVFEGLACGTPVLSTYSTGVKKTFPEIVLIAEKASDLNPLLKRLNDDRLAYEEIALKGIREVYSNHLYEHRLQRILEKSGVTPTKIKPPSVSLLCRVKNEEEILQALDITASQVWKETELVLLLEGDTDTGKLINKYNNQTVSVLHLNSVLSLNTLIADHIQSVFIAFLNLENHYASNYLLDLVQASIYADADIFGKNSYYKYSGNKIELVEGKENSYLTKLKMDSSIIKSAKLENHSLNDALTLLSSSQTADELFGSDVRGFSTNRFNFVDSVGQQNYKKLSKQLAAISI
jgi:spore maturation protein CgeB